MNILASDAHTLAILILEPVRDDEDVVLCDDLVGVLVLLLLLLCIIRVDWQKTEDPLLEVLKITNFEWEVN